VKNAHILISAALLAWGCCSVEKTFELPGAYRCTLEDAAADLAGPNGNPSQAFKDAIKGCGQALKFYEGGAATIYTIGTLIGLAGGIAGGVVVPMLTAAANANRAQIAAWGGVSGVANTAQVGLSKLPAASLQVREGIRQGLSAALDDYVKADNPAGQKLAIAEMIVACLAPPFPPVAAAASSEPCAGSVQLPGGALVSTVVVNNACIDGAHILHCAYADGTTPGPDCKPAVGQAKVTGIAGHSVNWVQAP